MAPTDLPQMQVTDLPAPQPAPAALAPDSDAAQLARTLAAPEAWLVLVDHAGRICDVRLASRTFLAANLALDQADPPATA